MSDERIVSIFTGGPRGPRHDGRALVQRAEAPAGTGVMSDDSIASLIADYCRAALPVNASAAMVAACGLAYTLGLSAGLSVAIASETGDERREALESLRAECEAFASRSGRS